MRPPPPPLTLATVCANARAMFRTVGDAVLFGTVCGLLFASSYFDATTNAMTGELLARVSNTTWVPGASDPTFDAAATYLWMVTAQSCCYALNVYVHQTACDLRSSRERVASFAHLLSLDQAFRDRYTAAEVENTMQVDSVHRFFCWNLPYLLARVFEFGLLFWYMARLHLPFTVAAYAVFLAVHQGCLHPFLAREQRQRNTQRALLVEGDDLSKEMFTMFSTIKLFGSVAEADHVAEYDRVQTAYAATVHPVVLLRCAREFVERAVFGVLLFALVGTGLHRTLADQMAPAAWTSFFLLLQRKQVVFESFQWHWGTLVQEYPDRYWYAQRRALRATSRPPTPPLLPLLPSLPVLPSLLPSLGGAVACPYPCMYPPHPLAYGELRMTDVHFAYPTAPDTAVLRGVTLVCPAQRMTAVVGPSGAGKSTVLKLLTGVYYPTAGTIAVGDDTGDNTADANVAPVAVVPQTPMLFRRTVRANVTYGNPTVGDARVREVLRTVCCDPFADRLDDVVSSESLSAGQCQRLAMARAVLMDAPVVVLDEVTSALDAESERCIQIAIERLVSVERRTVVVVAHRLRTVERAHQIVCLDAGRVAETGTHAELMARRGAYWASVTGHPAVDSATE